ncbi:uncharacterized protein LOC122668815 isoform X2 [Telopea speciosissima]|uniref:uncharacterized protein LOC122668815 isoform X2 n=1 Tax=Telopea speciosissima TaxID=54955 RepID=UPI001CC458C0|nr:uncharacterized protein LOC122668815 isoform X2 [Telopea speciosissima]
MAETVQIESRKKKRKKRKEDTAEVGEEWEEFVSGDDKDDGEGERVVPSWDKGKKRKRFVEEKEERSELRQDPLVVFGSDIMLMILSRLDARSVALSLLVSHGWHGVASSDRLWSSKIRIMKEDLCDHVWEFRFTKAAPEYWRNLDPFWKGTGPSMRRYFQPDGTQTADSGDQVWGGHECTYSIVTSFVGEGRIREHYVRINRWPQMSVSRKQDWSWELGNHLYCYSSIPDADKEGGTGPFFPVW